MSSDTFKDIHYNQTLSSEIDRSHCLISILRCVELKFYLNDEKIWETLTTRDANMDRNVPNYSLPARCICSIRTPHLSVFRSLSTSTRVSTHPESRLSFSFKGHLQCRKYERVAFVMHVNVKFTHVFMVQETNVLFVSTAIKAIDIFIYTKVKS